MIGTVIRGALIVLAMACTVGGSSAQTPNASREPITIDELVEKLKIVNTGVFLDARCRQLSEDDWIELFWHFTALARATSRPEFLPGVWVLQVNVRQNAANQPCDAEAERRANDALMVAREMITTAESGPRYDNEQRALLMYLNLARAIAVQISDDACPILGDRRAELDDTVKLLANIYFAALDRMGARMQTSRVGEYVAMVRDDFDNQLKNSGRSINCGDGEKTRHEMSQLMFEIGIMLRRPTQDAPTR